VSASGSATHIAGRRALVVGLGTSGAAAALALVRAGAAVRVLEGSRSPASAERAEVLRQRGAEVLLGADLDDGALLDAVELVVTSPGVPPSRGVLTAAAAQDVEVWSEPELAWRLAAGRTQMVGVTGTNGKTSTTQLLASCLDAPAAGNIGTPLSELLGGDRPPALVVAELSSFQLHHAHTLHPRVAVLLNLAPDHLDWHGGEEAYGDAKARLWARQEGDDVVVANADDAGAMALVARRPPRGRLVRSTLAEPDVGEVGVADGAIVSRLGGARRAVVDVADVAVRGPHELANACAAVAAALSADADAEAVAAALRAFRPGPHRLEEVGLLDGVRYVNDSKATNPHAAGAALGSFPSVVWIAGGLAKGLDLRVLSDVVAERVRVAVTIGTSGPDIAAMCRDIGVEAVEATTLDRAVIEAARVARPGDTVLLAPACASMDQFTDYAERGTAFRDAVARLTARTAQAGTDAQGAPHGQ
jgi:UDP-N-acetylmuramoylalanine--D-glutamate ligase